MKAHSIWVKICGITCVEDALQAAQAGTDAIGVNLVPTSPRGVTRKTASEILTALPSTLETVAVVANESPEFLKGLLRVCPFKTIQFHGEETPEEVLALKGRARLIKAVRVKDAQSLDAIPLYRGVDAIVLDTYRRNQQGGTGEAFNWDLVKETKSFGIPIIVAGGLNPGNVRELIREVEPYGVDVASGVETAPGKKDPALVREFILKAKSVV